MTTTSRRTAARAATVVTLIASVTTLRAQSTPGVISGPVGPSPYDIVRAWHKPFSEPGTPIPTHILNVTMKKFLGVAGIARPVISAMGFQEQVNQYANLYPRT